VDLQVDTNVSEEFTITLFSPENGDCVSPKLEYLPASPHGVATQKTNIDIFTAVRTSNLTTEVYSAGQEILRFYGTRKFVSMLIKALHRTLHLSNSTKFTPSQYVSAI
jgi:hypothetical protein